MRPLDFSHPIHEFLFTAAAMIRMERVRGTAAPQVHECEKTQPVFYSLMPWLMKA